MSMQDRIAQEEQAAEEALKQAYAGKSNADPIANEAEGFDGVDGQDGDAGIQDEGVDDAPVTAPASAQDPASEEWKHRYDVLKGKYDAEVPRLHDELRYWRDRAETLADQVRTPQEPANPQSSIVADQDLADIIGDDAAVVVARLLAKQKADFESKLDQAQQLSQRSAQDRFWDRVYAAFPNYQTMQHDPALNQWMGGSWPGSRYSRLQQAQQLVNDMDSDGFVALLKAYQPTTQEPLQPRKPPAPTPRRAAGSGTPPPEKTTLTPAELEAQSNRVIQLRKSGRRQEADALERILDTAFSEGRIRA